MNNDTPRNITPYMIDCRVFDFCTLHVIASFDGSVEDHLQEKFYIGIATRVDSDEPEKAICIWREEIEVIMPKGTYDATVMVRIPIDAIPEEARTDCHLMVFDETGRWIYGRKTDILVNL